MKNDSSVAVVVSIVSFLKLDKMVWPATNLGILMWPTLISEFDTSALRPFKLEMHCASSIVNSKVIVILKGALYFTGK